jgi:hypothetical protein
MEPEKKIGDEDFLKMYESEDRDENRLDKYTKGKDSKSFNLVWWIFLVILFLVAYLLFSKYMFPPKV